MCAFLSLLTGIHVAYFIIIRLMAREGQNKGAFIFSRSSFSSDFSVPTWCGIMKISAVFSVHNEGGSFPEDFVLLSFIITQACASFSY